MVIWVLYFVISIRIFHVLSACEFQMAIQKLKRHKSPGVVQITTELLKAGGTHFLYEITKLIKSIWNMEEFPVDLKESIAVHVSKKSYKTAYSNYKGLSLL